MPPTKLRGLGQYGIVTDADPYDLPPQAFSMGTNVRFYDGKVSRGPVMRKAGLLANTSPRSLAAYINGGSTNLYVAYKNGTITQWTPTAETDVSISGYTPSDNDAVYSHCVLSGVLYFNREDRVPWAFGPSDVRFSNLANWDATWRCKVLRAFNSSLIALNVTKGGISYPQMVKTSDFTLWGNVPASWDETSTTNNAYENVLAEMQGPIVDGLKLGSAFYIYSSNNETWEMLPTEDTNVYSVKPKFSDAGAINTNCVVEADSKHFVFGSNDLWMHDGTGKRSIADGRVRKFVFKSLQAANASSCFVAHNPNLKEIAFCFVSGDRLVSFNAAGEAGCNRAAIYNYRDDKWTFDDIPRVFAADLAPLSNSPTWASVTATWSTIGGAWQSLEDGFTKGLFYAGGSATGLASSLYANDLYGDGSLFTFVVDTTANPSAVLERDGIDLDELDEDLVGYKTCRGIVPQARVDLSGASLEFAFGSSDTYNASAVFTDYQTYDGVTDTKCDFMASGRYLSMKMLYQDYKTFSLSGFDFDFVVTAERP